MRRHPRITVVILLVLILAVLGIRTARAQREPATTRSPGAAAPASDARAAARASRDLRIVIAVARRRLWVVTDSADTLLSAPVAVGSGKTLRGSGQSWHFTTPRGVRAVQSREEDPVWVRPDWAYVEVARELGLRLDSVSAHRPRTLRDGRTLTVRENLVGVLTDSATFEPLPVDDEIIFGRVLYIPPIGTENRAVRGTLGKFRLNLGDGIGLHGTPDESSVGRAVTHGCLRLAEEPLAWVYAHVPVGTKVYIY